MKKITVARMKIESHMTNPLSTQYAKSGKRQLLSSFVRKIPRVNAKCNAAQSAGRNACGEGGAGNSAGNGRKIAGDRSRKCAMKWALWIHGPFGYRTAADLYSLFGHASKAGDGLLLFAAQSMMHQPDYAAELMPINTSSHVSA